MLNTLTKPYIWATLLWAWIGTTTTFAADINLKITYNGAGVAHNDITVKVGDAVLGKGKTDADGNVSIDGPSSFPRNIDVYGHVSTPNGEKNWDLKGWVALDDQNFFHIKMEDVLAEMGDMGMPTRMIAEAWGLVFSTQNSGGSGSSDSQSNPSGSSQTQAAPTKPAEPAMPSGYKCRPLSPAEFAGKKTAVENAGMSANKISQAQSAIKGNCLEASQIKELVALISMGNDQLELAKFGYDHVANPSGYSVVEEALSMDMHKKDLREYIADKESGGKSATSGTTTNAPGLPPTVPAGANYTLTVFTEAGEAFYLTLDGVRQNTTPQSRVEARWVNTPGKRPHFIVEFEDKNIPTIDQKVLVGGYADYANYKIKQGKKGEYVLRLQAN
jgi:hypothetical protein